VTIPWARQGDTLLARVSIHSAWRAIAEAYVAHRLRRLRAVPRGFLQPCGAILDADSLVLGFAPGRLGRPPAAPLGAHAWDDVALPLLDLMVQCHAQRHAGLGPIVDAEWTPPVSWFLPAPDAPDFELERRRDLDLAGRWLESLDDAPREVRAALAEGDHAKLARLLTSERQHARLRAMTSPPPPSFLTLLTEAELLERVGTVYRYTRARDRERGGDVVLEVDRRWRDPHFEIEERPTPQEVWDELTEDTRATLTLALSDSLPNPLQPSLQDNATVRWVGVHEDQPLIYVDSGIVEVPDRGFLRPFLAGDNTLLRRKREFTGYAGEHHALVGLLATPPERRPFAANPQRREDLEDAILATQGIFAVQGPPGTGKTHLATEVVRRLLSRVPHARVLVCAKEHFALDHILRKITLALEADGVPLRAWRSVSLSKRRRGRGSLNTQWLGVTVTRDLAERGFANGFQEWGTWARRGVQSQDQRLASMGRRAANLFFATTTDAAMIEALGNDSWDLVIVEEAGKCYPSEVLHALALGRTALMIGDHRQLPPFQERRTRQAIDSWTQTLDRAAREPRHAQELHARLGPLFSSLDALRQSRGPLTEEERAWVRPFEYLFERLPTRHRLEEQFRMEAPLSRLIGRVFYDRAFDHRKPELVERGLLTPRPLGDAIPSSLDVPLLWLDTPHMTVRPEATEDAQKRGLRDNQFEADAVVAYLSRLRRGAKLDFVILTPYNAQKALLLRSSGLRDVCADLTDRPFEELVRTTDEYQGRESELVVLSLVRNNSLGQRAWGFIAEPERLNVMLSRARFRLVVVGCMAHIERHAAENPWLAKVLAVWREEAVDTRSSRVCSVTEVYRG
jgi:hypothetical protein